MFYLFVFIYFCNNDIIKIKDVVNAGRPVDGATLLYRRGCCPSGSQAHLFPV